MMRVERLTCMVTGASRGIGAAVARELARRGCRIALVSRSAPELGTVAKDCRHMGGEARAFLADVAQPDDIGKAAEEAVAWMGGVKLLVVNAGIGRHEAALAHDSSAVTVTSINYLGGINTIRAVAGHLLSSPPAAVVAVSSLAALIPFRGGGVYGASKAALIAYLRCLRLELADRAVRVAWVCPAAVATEMIVDDLPHHKLPRLSRWLIPVLSAERVAEEVVRAAEGGRPQRVIPASAAFFASFSRHMPRLAESVEKLTGAGDL